jgi:predicted NUDIX family NTP pyrophosphohydrolase
MSIIPVTVPTGAIRYNTDSNKMECFDGTKWWEVAVSSPDLNGGARGVFGGSYTYGTSPANYLKSNIIDYITIATAGNAIDFGDLTQIRGVGGAGASRTRGLFCGGDINPDAAKTTATVDYVTISSTGNATDYGDLTEKGGHGIATMSNQTRLVCAGRNTQNPPSVKDIIDYTTITSAGNFVDFGDLDAGAYGLTGAGNAIRGIISQGDLGPAYENTIRYITIPTLGDSQDFGEATFSSSGAGAVSSATRCLIGGGSTPGSIGNLIDYITIATTGNAIRFGELDTSSGTRRFPGAVSNCIRGVWAGGYGNAPTYTGKNKIDYVTIATEGDAVDFGDLTAAMSQHAGCSNGHGGL